MPLPRHFAARAMIQINAADPEVSLCSPMKIPFRSAALSTDQASLALPLVQATWPDVDLPSWLCFVQFFCQDVAEKSGILTISDLSGYLCGVLAYRRDRDLRLGFILSVHLFTAVDVANSLLPVRALLDAMEARATELGCAGVQIRMDPAQSQLAARLRILGLSSEVSMLRKRILQRGGSEKLRES